MPFDWSGNLGSIQFYWIIIRPSKLWYAWYGNIVFLTNVGRTEGLKTSSPTIAWMVLGGLHIPGHSILNELLTSCLWHSGAAVFSSLNFFYFSFPVLLHWSCLVVITFLECFFFFGVRHCFRVGKSNQIKWF